MYELEFELKGLPKLINQLAYTHWTVKQKHNAAWKGLVVMTASPRRPKEPLKKARLTLTRYSSREPDFDGLVSSWKSLIDGLKAAGVIEDDKMSVIGQPVYLWEKVGPRNGKVKIKVEGATA